MTVMRHGFSDSGTSDIGLGPKPQGLVTEVCNVDKREVDEQ